MIPEELHVLRQVEELSLEEFKGITQRLNSRAVSDPWARTVILDLVRLPHAAEVSAKVRTAALGALISEARRLGRLSLELEKEVFAVSAEIPSLPFLGDSRSEDQEFLLEEQDQDY
jgi:formiminotetrahydrofolate cyclodeaminase